MKPGYFRLAHGFGYQPTDSYEVKYAAAEKCIRKYQQDGYSGIVTNVDFYDNYVRNEEEYRLMRDKAELCRSLGMRMWIYDESGYPSGAAGGRTLEEDPSCEARAAVLVHCLLKPGEETVIALPKGHERPISAFGYYLVGEKLSEQELQAEPIRAEYGADGFHFSNKTEKNLLCLAFFEKYVYEGSHAQHNGFCGRRYIDIGNKKTGEIFFRNTYQPYFDTLREYIEDGTIEAVFTDEPSYMGYYINPGLWPQRVQDPYPEIPLYPPVNWSKNLPEAFLAKYGYRVEDHMPALFLGGDERFANVRRDFYCVLSDLAEEAYFKTLGEGCAKNNINFSGHLLLEDKLSYHPFFEGNFFQYVRHMQTPGMDMLQGCPERVWDEILTPLLIRSVSELYRDGHVMNEICPVHRRDATAQELFGTLSLLFATGPDVFTSYLGDKDSIEIGTGENMLRAVQKLQLQFPTRRKPAVVLYYPIENMMRYSLPEGVALEGADTTKQLAAAVEKDMESCMYGLLNAQVSFWFSDTGTLDLAAKHQPAYFIVPGAARDEALKEKIRMLTEMGCQILVMSAENDLENTVTVRDFAEIREILEQAGLVRIHGDSEGIVALWSDGKLLLVNIHEREKTITLDFAIRSATECYSGQEITAVHKDGKTELTIPALGVLAAEL